MINYYSLRTRNLLKYLRTYHLPIRISLDFTLTRSNRHLNLHLYLTYLLHSLTLWFLFFIFPKALRPPSHIPLILSLYLLRRSCFRLSERRLHWLTMFRCLCRSASGDSNIILSSDLNLLISYFFLVGCKAIEVLLGMTPYLRYCSWFYNLRYDLPLIFVLLVC